MMKIRLVATLGSVAIVAMLASATQATVLEFGNHSSNEDMLFDYGSNIVAGSADEFDISNGATPDVALSWGPSDHTNVLEFHNSTNWIAPMTGGKLQFDVDASSQPDFPPAPTVDFSVPAGVSVVIESFIIGHAKDMHIFDGAEPAHDWTINLINLDTNAVVATHTTTALSLATQTSTALGSGAAETVNFNFTGDPGVSYRLLFDDGGDDSLYPSNFDGTVGNHPRAAIDNLSFSQVVPEPSTLALITLCGLGIATRRRRS